MYVPKRNYLNKPSTGDRPERERKGSESYTGSKLRTPEMNERNPEIQILTIKFIKYKDKHISFRIYQLVNIFLIISTVLNVFFENNLKGRTVGPVTHKCRVLSINVSVAKFKTKQGSRNMMRRK